MLMLFDTTPRPSFIDLEWLEWMEEYRVLQYLNSRKGLINFSLSRNVIKVYIHSIVFFYFFYIADVDSVLSRMQIIGVILCFRLLCQEALEDVLEKRIPFLVASIQDFHQHASNAEPAVCVDFFYLLFFKENVFNIIAVVELFDVLIRCSIFSTSRQRKLFASSIISSSIASGLPY